MAYNVHSKWTVLGTVGHWGHVHTRKNAYEAQFTMEVVDDAWKITGLKLLDERRIDPYAQARTEERAADGAPEPAQQP